MRSRRTACQRSAINRVRLMVACVATLALNGCATAPPATPTPAAAQAPVGRDGQHDFDFEFGTWKTKLRRLVGPLTGSSRWVEYEGTTVVTKVWGGRANLVELVADGPAGRIEGLNLRLYDPQTRRWSLNFASPRSGVMATPTIGAFDPSGERGEFYADETLNSRPIRVRFVISRVGADVWRFEQAFSPDGGVTWEVNWIAIDTRA
jgi:hypothetical protein